MSIRLTEATKEALKKSVEQLCKKPFFANFKSEIKVDDQDREVMQLRMNDKPDGVVLSTDNPQIFDVMGLATAICEDSIVKTMKNVVEVKLAKTIGIDLGKIPVDVPLADIMEDYLSDLVYGINQIVSEHNGLEFISNKQKALDKISKKQPIDMEDLIFSIRSKTKVKFDQDSETDTHPIQFQSPELIDLVLLGKGIEVGMGLVILDFMDRGITANGPSELGPDFVSKNNVSDYKDMIRETKNKYKNKDKLN